MNRKSNHQVCGKDKIRLNVAVGRKQKERKGSTLFLWEGFEYKSLRERQICLFKFLPKMYVLMERSPEQRKQWVDSFIP